MYVKFVSIVRPLLNLTSNNPLPIYYHSAWGALFILSR